VRRLVFDTGPFLLLFTSEAGSDKARKAVLKHENGEIRIYMHPNNLAEAYKVMSRIIEEKQGTARNVKPEQVVRSAYTTFSVVYDTETTIKLGMLKLKYGEKPWGDLSSAALSLRLSEESPAPVVVLDNEKHFEDIKEVSIIRVSELDEILE